MRLHDVYESKESLTINTDKNTIHSFLDVYAEKFDCIKESATKVMEIGVQNGGSIKLWEMFFENAEVYGMDINFGPLAEEYGDRVKLITNNAYTPEAAAEFEDESFDMIIDDGPHTAESQRLFIELYWSKIKPGGMLVIEDIPHDSVLSMLENTARKYCDNVEVVDIRSVKGRFDDLMLWMYK